MKLTFENKKKHINVYGNAIDELTKILQRIRIGKIEYDPRFGKYKFSIRFLVTSLHEDNIEELNDKIQELKAKRRSRGE